MNRNSTYWDRKPQYYLTHALNRTTENKRLEWLLHEYLRDHEFSSFLEVGCAAGSLFGILKEMYGRRIEDMYFGIDISKNSVAMAQILYPGGWFKWMDVTDYKFVQDYDVIYSSEVLPHLELKYQKKVIKALVTHAKKLALFSLKFSDIEELEHSFISKELPIYYAFPNYDDISVFIEKIAKDKEVKMYKTYGYNKSFIKGTKFYGKTGNLSVEVVA